MEGIKYWLLLPNSNFLFNLSKTCCRELYTFDIFNFDFCSCRIERLKYAICLYGGLGYAICLYGGLGYAICLYGGLGYADIRMWKLDCEASNQLYLLFTFKNL